jgi:signal transduction histidine kinase/YHS domain-containing protein
MIRTFLEVLLAGGNIWFYLRVIRPLRQLAARASQIASGDFTALDHTYGGVPEIDTVGKAMNAMVGHVRRAQAQERTYIQALTNGQEEERARIARELHDDTVQSFIAIAQSLEIARSIVGEESDAGILLKASRDQAIESVDNLRHLIANLRPPILAELGLIPALQVLAESTRNIEVSLQTTGTVRRLSETQELVLFRSVQETIRNAQRHGRACQISIDVNYEPDAVHLSIRDDGVGFEVPESWETLSAQGHYGLIGISERIQHLDGTLRITSQPAQGAHLEIVLPVRSNSQPDGVVRDPVCSAIIVPDQAYSSVAYRGKRYYFCCPVCQGAFQQSPHTYVEA